MSTILICMDWRERSTREKVFLLHCSCEEQHGRFWAVRNHLMQGTAHSSLQKLFHHLKWQWLKHTMYVAISSGASPSRSNLKVTILWLWVSNWHSTILSPVLHTYNENRTHNKYIVSYYIICEHGLTELCFLVTFWLLTLSMLSFGLLVFSCRERARVDLRWCLRTFPSPLPPCDPS